MNYGEEIAYWYLRLNGFFPITNFVIHRSSAVKHTSDCDLLAVRFPNVYEEIGGNPEDWDEFLLNEIGFGRIVGIICEVKTGDYDLKDIFRSEYIKYSIGRLGFLPLRIIKNFSSDLANVAFLDSANGNRVCKLLIANEYKESNAFKYRSLNSIEDFIEDRVRKYSDQKYADRMFFGSDLFQHTIHRIHREKEQRNRSKEAPTSA